MKTNEGKRLVVYVRRVIEAHIRGKKIPNLSNFTKHAGVFVTIHSFPTMLLRGCIGIPEPIYSIRDAIKEAAISACNDPRFTPLQHNELEHIIVEITILTPPQPLMIKRSDLPKSITVGQDGIIVEKGYYRGLLLPQVAVQYEWNAKDFLDNACIKAGLPSNAWLNQDVQISIFQGEIFAEAKPYGNIKKI
jgi:uncharacterized protein (TIGR00296 family)